MTMKPVRGEKISPRNGWKQTILIFIFPLIIIRAWNDIKTEVSLLGYVMVKGDDGIYACINTTKHELSGKFQLDFFI